MGGHRIDLVRTFSTIFTIAEAIAIVILLHYGYGLFAMASVMAISELCYVGCCYFASRKVVPQVDLGLQSITKSVVRELFRFAGSYQLVNVLEVVYAAILPITILREFGAAAAGVFAITQRLVSSAGMLPDSFLHPILSGGSMIYASGSTEAMRKLISKAYKMTMGLSLFPLAFLSVFGGSLVYAWTGQANSSFRVALVFGSLTVFFSAFSMLGLVLYRVSGNVFLDNVRQILRILTLVVIALLAHKLGFYGVLAGWASAELIGMLFMVFALMRTFPAFHFRDLLPDTVRLTLSAAIMLAAGAIFATFPLPQVNNPRTVELVQLGKITIGCLLAAWPALLLTRSITSAEGRAIIHILVPRRFLGNHAVVEGVRH
jgi:O-antigen/teichoic acid export membrane protein